MVIEFDFLMKKYKMDIKGIIHVGAHHGEEYKIYTKHNINNVVWIDCNSELVDQIRDRLTPHKIIDCLVSDHKGKESLWKTNQTQSWSIFKPKKNLVDRQGLKIDEHIEMNCDTLDNLISDSSQYNFINLDIQGGELKAFKGFTEGIKHMDYIYTEVHTAETYEGCPKIADIDKFLGQYGFKRVEQYIYPKGWGDAFYIKGK